MSSPCSKEVAARTELHQIATLTLRIRTFSGVKPPETLSSFPVSFVSHRALLRSLLMNAETNQPFTYSDTCVAYGARLGYQPEAAKAATEAVEALMKSLFSLG